MTWYQTVYLPTKMKSFGWSKNHRASDGRRGWRTGWRPVAPRLVCAGVREIAASWRYLTEYRGAQEPPRSCDIVSAGDRGSCRGRYRWENCSQQRVTREVRIYVRTYVHTSPVHRAGGGGGKTGSISSLAQQRWSRSSAYPIVILWLLLSKTISKKKRNCMCMV